MPEFLEVAIEGARKAEKIIKKYYSQDVEAKLKTDLTFVTKADQEAEDIIKQIIKKYFPSHSILGEETGIENKKSEYIWIIDPLDGTKNFLRKIPFFGTQIALMKGDEIILGVSNAPIMKELIYAEKNKGAFLNREKISVSPIKSLNEAYMSYGSLNLFDKKSILEPLIKLDYNTRGHRGFGDCWSYHLLAQGKVDIMVEAETKIWDIAASSCIIEESGGKITDISGNKITLDTNSAIATNGFLHNEVLNYFNK